MDLPDWGRGEVGFAGRFVDATKRPPTANSQQSCLNANAKFARAVNGNCRIMPRRHGLPVQGTAMGRRLSR